MIVMCQYDKQNGRSILLIRQWYTQYVKKSTLMIFLKKLARNSSRNLNLVTANDRAACINKFAELLDAQKSAVMAANVKDVEEAKKNGLSANLIGRLTLTPAKIQALSVGLRQVAESSKTILGKVLRRTLWVFCLNEFLI